MILINLLPHREAARKRRKEAFNVTMLLSLLVGVGLALLLYLWLQHQLSEQEERNHFLQSQVALLDQQIKEIAGLEGEIGALRARQKAVEDLQADRNLPVHLLAELVQQVPEGVYIQQIKQTDQSVEMKGVAHSNERVSEMLRNLTGNTPWFAKPELHEIVATKLELGPRDHRSVVSFNLRFQLLKSSPPASGSAAIAQKGV